MTIEIRFRPEAEADVLEAHVWYRERGLSLAEEFLRSLDASLDLIRRLPESHPVVHRQVRRALLRRFPYGIFYVHEGNTSPCWPVSTRVVIQVDGKSGPNLSLNAIPHLA